LRSLYGNVFNLFWLNNSINILIKAYNYTPCVYNYTFENLSGLLKIIISFSQSYNQSQHSGVALLCRRFRRW